jgi:hypothetical protein
MPDTFRHTGLVASGMPDRTFFYKLPWAATAIVTDTDTDIHTHRVLRIPPKQAGDIKILPTHEYSQSYVVWTLRIRSNQGQLAWAVSPSETVTLRLHRLPAGVSIITACSSKSRRPQSHWQIGAAILDLRLDDQFTSDRPQWSGPCHGSGRLLPSSLRSEHRIGRL